jgi:hypothetical protein
MLCFYTGRHACEVRTDIETLPVDCHQSRVIVVAFNAVKSSMHLCLTNCSRNVRAAMFRCTRQSPRPVEGLTNTTRVLAHTTPIDKHT